MLFSPAGRLMLGLVIVLISSSLPAAELCGQSVVELVEKTEISFVSAASSVQGISTCDCELDDNTKETPLHGVVNRASHGDAHPGALTVLIKKLVANRANVMAVDVSGATALHMAAFHGEATAVAAIATAAGWKLHDLLVVVDNAGFTVLARALANGQVAAARMLVLSGAKGFPPSDSMECTSEMVTAVLASRGQLLSQALEAIVGGNTTADCMVPPIGGRKDTLLHLAVRNAEFVTDPADGLDVVQKLLEAGADPMKGDFYGDIPLACAVRSDQMHVAQLLLQYSPSNALAAKNAKGQTVLHLAAEAGATKSVRMLVVSGAPLDAQDVYGSTALDYARRYGHAEAIDTISGGEALAAAAEADLEKGQNSSSIFKSSAKWTEADEEAAEAQEEEAKFGGIFSTEILAAGIVGFAVICCSASFCILWRSRAARYKTAVVAAVPSHEEEQEDFSKGSRRKRSAKALTDDAHARSSSRSGSDSDVSDRGMRRMKLPSVVVQAGPRTPMKNDKLSLTDATSFSEAAIAAQARAATGFDDLRSPAMRDSRGRRSKSEISQGPRSAAKASKAAHDKADKAPAGKPRKASAKSPAKPQVRSC